MQINTRWQEAIKRGILIGRFFTGKTSGKEEEALRDWRTTDATNERLMNEIIVPENFRHDFEQFRQLQNEQGYNRIFRKTNRRKIYYRVAGIAAGLLLIGGLAMYRYLPVNQPAVYAVQEIQPGSPKALLHIPKGEVVAIHENMSQTFLSDSSVRVADNQLVHNEGGGDEHILPYVLEIPRGGEFTLVLPDGTKVWLNAESRLEYPASFKDGQRAVSLEGEAYFDVTPDSERPFLVHTPRSTIRVYGTAFNVNAYPLDSREKMTLERGKIGVMVEGREHILKPDQQLILKQDNEVRIVEVDARKQGVWRTGSFLFEEERLEDVMGQLSRWYDVEVFFADPEARELHFSGELNRYENISRILEMIELTTHVSFTVKGKAITIILQ